MSSVDIQMDIGLATVYTILQEEKRLMNSVTLYRVDPFKRFLQEIFTYLDMLEE